MFYRPGQGFKLFTVMELKNGLTASGKVKGGEYIPKGDIVGILASASEQEKELWKQKGHPISHKIVQQGIVNRAFSSNYLVLSEPGTEDRYFYIQGTGNPGELNHLIRYFVEERKGLTYE